MTTARHHRKTISAKYNLELLKNREHVKLLIIRIYSVFHSNASVRNSATRGTQATWRCEPPRTALNGPSHLHYLFKSSTEISIAETNFDTIESYTVNNYLISRFSRNLRFSKSAN